MNNEFNLPQYYRSVPIPRLVLDEILEELNARRLFQKGEYNKRFIKVTLKKRNPYYRRRITSVILISVVESSLESPELVNPVTYIPIESIEISDKLRENFNILTDQFHFTYFGKFSELLDPQETIEMIFETDPLDRLQFVTWYTEPNPTYLKK